MELEVVEEELGSLEEHAGISAAFPVERILELSLVDAGLGGMRLAERTVAEPVVKDHDADTAEDPTHWTRRFDTAHWGLLGAHCDGERVGGAVVAVETPGLRLAGPDGDVAVLWDVRVRPDARRHGVGIALFGAVEAWVAARGCRRLMVETQNVNVAACRLYARMGCELGAIDRFAYPELPGEVQLVWWKDLG